MQKSETYYIYENWQVGGHKARLHRSSCPYCNHGKGFHLGSSEEHGRWHGPYDSLKEAIAKAQTIRGVMSFCRHCSQK